VLEIQPRDIKASYRRIGNIIETVLYDAVSGGAGYSVRLYQDITLQKLLEKSLDILRCPNDCETACRSCLCDYSNQIHWDQLNRRILIKWIEQLLDATRDDPLIKAGGMRWKTPNLSKLTEILAGCKEVHVVGSVLESPLNSSDDALQWIIQAMNDGKKISLHLLNSLETKSRKLSPRLRHTFRYLQPYISDGCLTISYLKRAERDEESPRIFSDNTPGSPLFLTTGNIGPILDTLVPEPLYQLKLDKIYSNKIKDIISASEVYSPEKLGEGLPIEMWDIRAGEERDLSIYFAVIEKGHLENLIIRDPYCAADIRHLKSLNDLIGFIQSYALKIEKIILHSRELHYMDKNYIPPYRMTQKIEESLKMKYPKLEVVVHIHPFKSNKVFHDRSIDFTLVDTSGCSTTYRFDLLGGIDRLMDRDASTKIFRYEVEN